MTQRQVTLEGGVPWGFRINGGVDQKLPLKVSKVNPGSKAAQRGIREGDLVTSIQGENTRNLTNSEAHNLLKKAGSTLKLGLNEDVGSSLKERQFRTIHQETHHETVKRSSVTYTLKETVERSSGRPGPNECQRFKSTEFLNGKDTNNENCAEVTIVRNIPVSQKSTSSSSTSTASTLIPEGINISSDHAVASRQSSYSNCSSIPDEGSQQKTQLDQSLKSQDMNDGQGRMSKSKKRRQRKKNLLNRTVSQDSQSQSEAEIDEIDSSTVKGIPEVNEDIVLEPSSKNLDILRLKRIEHKYKVESPKELKLEHAKDVKKLKAKSKSLDDDDLLKIQELSEASETEDTKYQPNVVISEASSEENLLDDFDFHSQKTKKSALSSMCLQLHEDNPNETTSQISPQEEQELRSFLGGLNLANSPEESAKNLYEKTTGLGDSKAKKLQKRKQLEEYFMPIAENPRYLDAISEEASDISDKECAGSNKSAQHIKQGTPEQDLILCPAAESSATTEVPVLVEAKVLKQANSPQEGICTTKVIPVEEQKAELVYLLDSSTSSISTEDFDDALDNIDENYEDTLEDKSQKSINEGSNTEENFSLQGNLELKPDIETKQKKEVAENNTLVRKEANISNSGSAQNGLQIKSNESYSTKTSSQTSTSKTISATLNYPSNNFCTQTNPPSTTTITTAFDYTKVPNILKQKEPELANDKCKMKAKEHILPNAKETNDYGNQAHYKKVETSEARSVSALHTSKKLVNGHLENAECRKVKVDELSRNGDVKVEKNFEEYILKPSDKLNGISKDEVGENSTNIFGDNLKDTLQSNDSASTAEEKTRNVFASSSEKSTSTINSNASTSKNSLSESQKEFVLRHVIMNSQDSNKTDSQKLVEFEKIQQLNNELKDKINKKELIGPTFKKSKSPAVDLIGNTGNGHDLLIMSCETQQPSRNLIEKRVKEFSSKDFMHEKTISGLTEFIQDDKVSETTLMPGNNLLKLRIKTFSNDLKEGGLEQGFQSAQQPILSDNNKISKDTKKEKTSNSIDNTYKAAETNNSNSEKIIQIKVENIYENVAKNDQESLLKPILCSNIDNELLRATNDTTKVGEKELIIPVQLEINNCNTNHASGKKETIIPVTIEDTQNKPSVENSVKPMKLENEILEKKITFDAEESLKSDQKPLIIGKTQSGNIKLSTFSKKDIQSISKTLECIAEKLSSNHKTETVNKVGQESPLHSDLSPPIPPRPKENEQDIPVEMQSINVPPVPPPRRSKTLLLNKRNAKTIESDMHQHLQEKSVSSKWEIPEKSETIYSNVISSPRPASVSSESSESEESSRCTVKYNPNSSLADVASIVKDEEMLEDKSKYEPLSLRDTVLQVLVCLPFGEEVLKELAEVSKSIEHFTNTLPFKGLVSEEGNVSVKSKQDMSTRPSNSYEDGHRKIMELHKNFVTRRRHDEGSHQATNNKNSDQVIITNIGNRETEMLSPNRLLTIIREEPNETEPTQEFTFFADNSEQRLKAKNLGEWLTLARHKSKSTSNLDCTNIPINNLRRTIQSEKAKFSNTRRRSLPQEIYEKQLIDIMEKEREIQRELEVLEEEKRKLRAEIAPSRQKEFQVDDFYVSKKGDFAEIREDVSNRQERPASMPIFPTEFFRQQMYEEYMDKFSERQERKQQKVIKISSSNDLEQEKDVLLRSKEIIHPIEIEQEFMDRVKAKLKQNISASDSKSVDEEEVEAGEETSSKINQNDETPPIIVLDRDKLKGVETLPRHLQEFVDDLTTQPDDCK